MNFSLTWLPDVLLQAGLMVAKVPGWEQRGRSEMGTVLGVLCHHTAGPRTGNMPSLTTLTEGRTDLAGPLAQLGLGRDGTYYVVAAGLCNHAGAGSFREISAGNTHLIGIEAENTGLPGDTWPLEQIRAYQQGVAAILLHVGRTSEYCIAHKEWAPTRKNDPLFDMAPFRSQVAGIMAGGVLPLAPIPVVEATAAPGGPVGRPTLRRGMVNDFVKIVQQKCQLKPDGWFGPATEAAVRELQRSSTIRPDGIVGPATWKVLDTRA